MVKVCHQVGIKGKIEAIFEALISPEGLSGWWASSANVHPELDGVYEVSFEGLTTLSFKICELKPPHSLELECDKGLGDWPESRLRFDLSIDEETNQVFLRLTHQKENASDEDFLYFNTKWPVFMLSLRDFIEKGKGCPFPNAIPISVDDK